jgi:hypothetical protein
MGKQAQKFTYCSELMKCPEERLRRDLPAASQRQDHGEVPGVDASERPPIHAAKRTTPTDPSTKSCSVAFLTSTTVLITSTMYIVRLQNEIKNSVERAASIWFKIGVIALLAARRRKT